MTRNFFTMLRKGILNRTAAMVLAGAASTVGFGTSAMAHDRFLPREERIDVKCGPDMRRIWVEPIYEERESRVWVEAVYRTVCDRVWVEGVSRDVVERVWVPAITQSCVERVWVEPLYRIVEKRDYTGRVFYRERVLSSPGHYVDQAVDKVITPAHWEDRTRREIITPGHFEERARQECVTPGHWEVRRERVCVRPGHWEDRPTGRSSLDIRIDGFAARIPLDRR